MDINTFRAEYPEYDDIEDEQLCQCVHQKYCPDIPPEQFLSVFAPGRPMHDDLEGASVTGEDSLNLQDLDPSIKPAVKMTVKELTKHLNRIEGKMAVIWNNAAYVIDPRASDPVSAIQGILSGDDSAMLGYPQRGRCDCCVTKQGEIVTGLEDMKRHAETKNVAWAANGEPRDLMDKARRVADVIKRKTY